MIQTQLNMHDHVVVLIEGKIVSLEINEIKCMIVPATEKEGGVIEYSGTRRDIARGRDASYEATHIRFNEKDLGVTVWKSKEDMIRYWQEQEVEPDYWQ